MIEFVISWDTFNGRHYSRFFSVFRDASVFGCTVRARSTTKEVRMRMQRDFSTPDCVKVEVLEFDKPF